MRLTLAWVLGLLALLLFFVAAFAFVSTPWCINLDAPGCPDLEPWYSLFSTSLASFWVFATLAVIASDPKSAFAQLVRRTVLASLGVVSVWGGVTGVRVALELPGLYSHWALVAFLPAGLLALLSLWRDLRQRPLRIAES